MRKYLAASLALFFVGVLCCAQSPRAGFPPGVFQNRAALDATSGFTPSCSQATTFLTAATGVTLTVDKQNYDNLICGLVTDGDFASFDAFYIWAAPTRPTALINLVNPGTFNGTEIGTPTSFTNYVGYTGDGSTFSVDSGFNPNSASSPKYVLNSAVAGAYIRSNITSGTSAGRIFGADNVGQLFLETFISGIADYAINNPGSKSVSSSTSLGQWVLTRTALSTLVLYRNGNTTPFDTDTTTSDFIPRANIYFFSTNGAGVASAAQMSAGFIGGGLSSAAMARVTGRINTYMTAYGINVY